MRVIPKTVEEALSNIEMDLYQQGLTFDDLSAMQLNEIERQLRRAYDEDGNLREINFSRFSEIENARGLEE